MASNAYHYYEMRDEEGLQMTRYGETQQEVADYLKLLTRRLAGVPKASFTTSAIADELSISRNLASQYLNELTRQGETCKVGNRPVFYLANPQSKCNDWWW